MKIYFFPLAVFAGVAATLSISGNALAEGAYHWVDSEGRDHYGSNPPKNARGVESLAGKSFSRYSSQKMLRPYKSMPISEDNVKATVARKPEGKVRAVVPTDLPIEEETLLPEISQGDITLKHDKENRVTECSVVLKNTATIPANSVLVNFEFPDGTFVPGSGPDSIDAESTAKYSVPDAMLPFHLNGVQGAPPKPKVVIKGAG